MYGVLQRRPARRVLVGGIAVGGDAPIVVQSMTNTDTANIAATVAQVKALADAGSELVRITVNTAEAAAAGPVIFGRRHAPGCGGPLVGRFPFYRAKPLPQLPPSARGPAKNS